jgi:hypothetical protein
MLDSFILAYLQFVIMVIELQKVLNQELKCLCSKPTTVLSERTVPKIMEAISYVFIALQIHKYKVYKCMYTVYKCMHTAQKCMYIYIYIYRVSHDLRSLLRESVPFVKIYRCNPKHLYPKLNGYGDNGQRKVWPSWGSTHCTCQLTV